MTPLLRGLLGCVLLGVVGAAAPVADPAWVLLVRHAEKEAGDGDVPLAEAGRERARILADMVADTGIDAVYTTQWKRNRETAAAVEDATGLSALTLSTARGSDAHVLELAQRLRGGRHAGEKVLCVEHSNTIPALLRTLGIPDPPDTAGYSQLYVVTFEAGAPRLLVLRYGAPEPANAPR
jgi:broad specificity phosphatase PhoE